MRKTVALVALPFLVIMSWLFVTALSAYRRAPELVARLEQAGLLSLAPESLPQARICALLTAQDPAFFDHHGIGLFSGPPGHTTVTQAIGKFMLFDQFSPGFLRLRKVQLMAGACGLDARLEKSVQLRVFLNRAYFGMHEGRAVVGFSAAAQTYFGKSLAKLEDAEFFSLLAMLDAPNRYHVLRAARLNRERARAIEQDSLSRCGT